MRAEKLQIIQEIKGLIENKPFFLITYKGLTTAQLSSFRAILAESGSECHIVPNNLFRQAAKQLNLDAVFAAELAGDTALVSGSSDPVALAKRFVILPRPRPTSQTQAWFVEDTLISSEEAIALADMPPRESCRLSCWVCCRLLPGSWFVFSTRKFRALFMC